MNNRAEEEEYDPRKPNDYAEAIKPVEEPVTSPASKVVVIRNLADEADEGLEDEVSEECQTFGMLQDFVMHSETEVQFYVKFFSAEAASKCREALNGRLFAGRVVRADFYSESLFARNELGRV